MVSLGPIPPDRDDPDDPGARARREHAEWLTWALRSGNKFPRIPLRRAAVGGWDWLTATPHGRGLADRWWKAALRRVFGPYCG
jgi:hypothetical protein